MSTLQEGAVAPPVDATNDKGETFHLADHKGKSVVLYFYPKADTPGCTTEACEFRDAIEDFKGIDAGIVGVSPDTPKALTKFKEKYTLPFTLLADEDHKVSESYGVWVEKSMYGKKYMGVDRSTFIIGKDGKVAKIFRKVKPAGHAEEVKQALAAQ
ncbi:MAG: thioredoxin-dependent thiol peroxidase [Bryobacteraceae bacterium]|nr:thioredoxin-dependent thiol peroxidase [Bryobacteraceae bacterium]